MEDFKPMASEELHDKGPWTVSEDGRAIESDDFTHDVILRVTGDFYSDEQRKAYAENLAKKLNVPNVKVTGLPQPDAGSETNNAGCGRSGSPQG